MCDERTLGEDDAYLSGTGAPSRRAFSAMSAAALAACAAGPSPGAASDGSLTESEIVIATPDGEADAHFVHPAGGAHAGVLVWPDIVGLRPSFRDLGRRLAQSGYAVLTVNSYYRVARSPILQSRAEFNDPQTRERLFSMMRALTPDIQTTDAMAFVDFLDAQDAVDSSKKIGTTGYCMGGPYTFRTAAARSGRVGAAASFHGASLVTDAPDSPHLAIPQSQAAFLVAIAQNDDVAQPDAKTTLRGAFDATSRSAEVEVYPAQHGWCTPDSPVYDEAQAERAWSRLLALFSTALA
ncbi:MAG: dienelactone hydrolase family protein [Alphaproteobacteria bacterium]|nr:dienelactone hydrolase family protein [Alphaproteobacteria bacterium]